jgi:hypothetical protein
VCCGWCGLGIVPAVVVIDCRSWYPIYLYGLVGTLDLGHRRRVNMTCFPSILNGLCFLFCYCWMVTVVTCLMFLPCAVAEDVGVGLVLISTLKWFGLAKRAMCRDWLTEGVKLSLVS